MVTHRVRSAEKSFVHHARHNWQLAPHFLHWMWPAPVQEADGAGAARSAMLAIGQARRHTLSASSTGPAGCLSAGTYGVVRLNRMSLYAFRHSTPYLPRRKSNAGHIECEKCGLAAAPRNERRFLRDIACSAR